MVQGNTKQILEMIVREVCSYLKINEDLFFCDSSSQRILEAKRYVCYFANIKYKIRPSVVSSYMGVKEKRASITTNKAKSIVKSQKYNSNGQTSIDIAELEKILC